MGLIALEEMEKVEEILDKHEREGTTLINYHLTKTQMQTRIPLDELGLEERFFILDRWEQREVYRVREHEKGYITLLGKVPIHQVLEYVIMQSTKVEDTPLDKLGAEGKVFVFHNWQERYKNILNVDSKGYRTLYDIPMHQILAYAIIGELHLKLKRLGFVVNHVDHNKKNNRLDNLEVISFKRNLAKVSDYRSRFCIFEFEGHVYSGFGIDVMQASSSGEVVWVRYFDEIDREVFEKYPMYNEEACKNKEYLAFIREKEEKKKRLSRVIKLRGEHRKNLCKHFNCKPQSLKAKIAENFPTSHLVDSNTSTWFYKVDSDEEMVEFERAAEYSKNINN